MAAKADWPNERQTKRRRYEPNRRSTVAVKQSQCFFVILSIDNRYFSAAKFVRPRSFVRLFLQFRFCQKLRQLIFPKHRDGVAAVTARFVAERNHDRATMRNSFDLAFQNSKL